MNSTHRVPPDQEQRDRIVNELDRSLLVEAAAGTGKTTSMVRRMVALLSRGHARIHTLAAVTFTRKSAAELRSRFGLRLEAALAQASGPAHDNLQEALARSERCFIGTIHSFCGRLLRERPVEAQVDIAFREIDEAEDQEFRRAAWAEHTARLYAENAPVLQELADLGIDVGDLWPSFDRLATYPDVSQWPAAAAAPPDVDQVIALLHDAAAEAERLEEAEGAFPDNYALQDGLMRKFGRVRRMTRNRDSNRLADLMLILRQFTGAKPDRSAWPGGPDQAKAAEQAWKGFRERAQEFLEQWRAHCYPTCLKALQPALRVYDGKREQAGVLNYQDLLMRAAALLRSNPDVRRYFRSRFTHLLVDEFQDTDPIQAEVMLLLTATDPEETDWEACRPVAGSLFVVGDPKQSIYRFRRADIVTYTKVRDIIDRDGNGIVTLQANFRSRPELIEWVNRVFGSQKGFPDQPTPYAPAYVSLEAGAPAPGPDDAQAVMRLDLPKNLDKDEIIAYETDLVARTIRRTVERSRARDTTDDARTRAEPGASFSDFMIITRNTHRLGAYAARLQEYDVPHRVVGGNALNLSGELDMLAACLDATINPDNPVALVRVLRGPLFGISDAQLYAFKRLGGEFNFQTPGRADMDHDLIKPIAEAYERLGNFHSWLKTLPPVSAIRRMTMDLGLPVPAGLQRGGNGHAGSLMKAIELIGEKSRGAWSFSKLVELVTGLSTGLEKHDTLPALERGEPSVMVMNLHKVKGLEAPLVFLADANGGAGGHKVTLHVDRSRGPGHGYMAMTRPTTGFHADVIATPRGWKTWEEEEKKFAEAEEIRLMYVAATRAGAGLTITQRHSYNNRNPWRFFEADVKAAPGVPDPGEVQTREAEALTISPEDVAGAQKLIRQGWQTVTTPTYGVAGAKALTGKPEARFSAVEEHGTLWGTAIHRLLEAAPSSDDAQLHALARSVWEDLQLSPDLIHQALETVRSVLASDLWARASAASRVLTETPFQTMVTESSDSEAHQEILMRGVIDLAFCENGSWVIVDYKTDRRPRGEIASLTEQYADQVMRYADAWRSLTNEPVHETGLFFTHHREYVPVRKGHVG